MRTVRRCAPDAAAAAAEAKCVTIEVEAPPTSLSQAAAADNPAVAIQKDWATVKAILTPQVLNLERTISEVQWALADSSTTIRLTDKKDVTQHVFEVVKQDLAS